MRSLIVVLVVLVVGVIAWSVVNRLSPDAIGMALGMGFGILAGIPASLLVFVASRQRAPWEEEDEDCAYPRVERQSEPVVLVFENYPPPAPSLETYRDEVTPYYNGARSMLGMPPLPERPKPDGRQFRIVGQLEEPGPEGVPPWLRS